MSIVCYEVFAGVVPFVAFLCRVTGNGSLLGRREEDVDAIECSDRTLSRLDVRLNVDVPVVVEATAIGICDDLTSESPILFIKLTKLFFFLKSILLLRTCGDIDVSSPDTDKSPIDDEFGGCCCCWVKDIIDDVRRDLSFDPFKMKNSLINKIKTSNRKFYSIWCRNW